MRRPAVRLIVQGRVQGVGYRGWAIREAQRIGVDGWVRNQRDGAVEILVIGPAEATGRLIEACRRGPAAAVVTRVACAEAEDDGSQGFDQRSTA